MSLNPLQKKLQKIATSTTTKKKLQENKKKSCKREMFSDERISLHNRLPGSTISNAKERETEEKRNEMGFSER